MPPRERIRDQQRGSLARIISTANDYAILVRLYVVVSLTSRRVKFKIISIAESEDKGEAVAVEIGRIMPFFCQKGAKNVASRVLQHENCLLVLL